MSGKKKRKICLKNCLQNGNDSWTKIQTIDKKKKLKQG